MSGTRHARARRAPYGREVEGELRAGRHPNCRLYACFDGWDMARAAVELYHKHHADRIVAEVNNGGDLVASVIRTIDPNVPVHTVTATRGKALRAEPVASLYEQHRVHHVGEFNRLEDQMVEWDPMDASATSPDRMDALVWAITDLILGNEEPGIIGYYRMLAERQQAKRG